MSADFSDDNSLPAVVEATTPVRRSGDTAPLSVDMSGNLRVNLAVGSVSIGSVTTDISGQLPYATGQSGIPFWQDESGVVGVTILSGNVAVSIPITSGSVIVSGTVSVNSGLVGVLSGSIGARVSGAVQVSGTVAVSGEVTVSGTVFALGMSGLPLAQVTSGTAMAVSSGQVHGGAVAHIAVCEPTAIIRASGQPNMIRVDANGNLFISTASVFSVRSGSISISSGLVGITSGLVGVLSGEVHILSGVVSSSGDLYTITNTGFRVSGTVAVSGEVFIVGNSGLRFPQIISGTSQQTNIGWFDGGLIAHIGVANAAGLPSVGSGQPSLILCDANGRIFLSPNSRINIHSGQINVTSGLVGVTSGEVHIMSGQVGILSGLIGILSGSIGAQVSGTVEISGRVSINSGLIGILSGSIGAQISGTVEVSGGVLVSGTVNIAGQSGLLVPQTISGWGHSGANVGHIGVAAYVNALANPTFLSGQLAPLTVNPVGQLRVIGTVSGLVAINSGLVGILSGVVSSSGDLYTITNTGFRVSGTVAVSGQVFVAGQSGINLWQDASGVVGVTIISSNIVTSTVVTSGSVQVSGAVIVSGNVGVSGSVVITSGGVFISGSVTVLNPSISGLSISGVPVSLSGTVAQITSGVVQAYISGVVTVNTSGLSISGVQVALSGTTAQIVSGVVQAYISGLVGTVASGTVNIAGQSGLLVPQVLSGWAHSGGNVGHLGIAAFTEDVVRTTRLSGILTPLSIDTSGNLRTTMVGSAISGQSVSLSGTVAQITSGVVQVYLSGGTASLSGLILTSGIFFASGIGVTLSGTVVQITSGVVQAYISGLVGVVGSGTVNVAGQSGLLVPQVLSGWAHSGANVGHLGVAAFTEDVVRTTRLSGILTPISIDTSGNVRVIMPGSAISGQSVSLSGTVAQITSGVVQVYLSGGTAALSGLILTSGIFFASGIGITLSGTTVQVTSGVVQAYISGVITVNTSGLSISGVQVALSGTTAQIVSGVVQAYISGAVAVSTSAASISGLWLASGQRVYNAGSSGNNSPQAYQFASGTLTSGFIGAFLVAPAVFEGDAVIRQSGQTSNLRVTQDGAVYTYTLSGAASTIASGLFVVVGSGNYMSGMGVYLSGITAQVTSGVVQAYLSGGTASLSGLILTSGIFFASGIGITLSGTVVQVTSGVVQAYISGLVGTVASGTMNIAGQSGLLVPQVLSGWAHSGANVGHFGVAAFTEDVVRTVRLSGVLAPVSIDTSGSLRVTMQGSAISGHSVSLSGTVAQITSGVVQVYLSGGTAALSGLILTSGIFFASGIGVTLSGTVAQITSGVVQAYISGIISSTVSGTVNIAGQSGLLVPQVLSGWAHSGGNVGHLGIAGFVEPTVVTARLSGQLAPFSLDISGNMRVTMPGSAISGHTVSLSGTVAQITSGVVQVYLSGGTASLSGLILTSGIFFASGIGITLSGTVAQITSGVVQAYISGAVQATVSGKVYVAGMSGINIWTDASGVVGVTIISSNISVSTSVNSGLFVVVGSGNYMSGMGVSVQSGVFIASGIATSVFNPTTGRARGTLMITSNSGGDLLTSGDCFTATVRMLTKGSGGKVGQSGFVMVGFDAAGERPYASSSGIAGYNSGYGFVLTPGDAVTYNIDNTNRLRVYALLSGEMVSYTANQT